MKHVLKLLFTLIAIMTVLPLNISHAAPKNNQEKITASPWNVYDTDGDIYIHFPKIRFFQGNGAQLTPEGMSVLTQFQNWTHQSFRSPQLKIMAMSGESPTRQYWWLNNKFGKPQEKQMDSRASAIKSFLHEGIPDGDIGVADQERRIIASEKMDLMTSAEESNTPTAVADQLLIIIIDASKK